MKIIVVGGGLSGLAASVFLSEKGYKVTLLEASPKLGGRAYTIFEPDSGLEFDNGQHLLMGCYKSTLRFLKLIGAESEIERLPLRVPFIKPDKGISYLRAIDEFYPLNLIDAITNFDAVNWKSRLRILALMLKIRIGENDRELNVSVSRWLKNNNQTDEAIENFWKVLCVGALNADPEKASASVFKNVIKRIFFSGKEGYKFILPRKNLRAMYIEKSKDFILAKGGRIFLSDRVLEFRIDGGLITKIVTANNVYDDFDMVVTALPAHALSKINFNGSLSSGIPSLEYSPILNIHLFLEDNPFTEKYYALLGTDYHWLFNHGKYLSITSSSAGKLIKKNNADLLSELYSNLELFFPIFNRKSVRSFRIIKEKRATFVPSGERLLNNTGITAKVENLFIGGDWTIPELPATIESAVQSAENVSLEIFNSTRVND
ncbi:hydroxysqualene dehydroxylase HpnE [Melioribacter sp. Ez-97]|uniref:hydroxysqualene dehydroxylase HpnE n=1 Tax=Melioribacter sp. Ez-97 TaxID=3423434 RepID=UPI003ED90976